MELEDFTLKNTATSNQTIFIQELLKMIEYYNPPMLSKEQINIIHKSDRRGEYLEISLPHRLEDSFKLWITVYDTEIIVFFNDAHEHFEQYDESNEWILEAVGFLSEVLLGSLETLIYYKGKKAIKVRTYFVNQNGEKELVSSCSFLCLALLNPFQKVRKVMKKVTFFNQ